MRRRRERLAVVRYVPSLRRLLERVETRLDRGNTAFERIDGAQPHRDVMEAVFQPLNCPVHHPPRAVDDLSECVLALVYELGDEVRVVRPPPRGRHARRIARLILANWTAVTDRKGGTGRLIATSRWSQPPPAGVAVDVIRRRP